MVTVISFIQRVSMAFVGIALIGVIGASGQELGGAGTVQGIVKDPTGGIMVAVTVDISNPVSGFKRSTTTDAAGKFIFRNLPPNSYHLAIGAQGFVTFERDIAVRSAVPIDIDVTLELAGTTSTIEVVGHAEDLLERDPTAHTDIDQSLIARLSIESSSGLNQVITLASPGVVSDSNGFFHPIGDHAQTQFSIDNQPVTDQQSRVYSNQISPEAVQSMEVITGVAPAEYGDKSSLVVHIVTKSGLGQPRPAGSVSASYGSFNSPTFEANLGGGSHVVGNFLSVSGLRTDRFLDPPELAAVHDTGNRQSFFDRVDVHPNDANTFHLNLQAARSSFDIPNTIDQAAAAQAQHQNIDINVAPGYSRVIGRTLLSVNGFLRQDRVTYLPSADPFADTPATVGQGRRLTNMGAKADLAYTAGAHNVKVGGTLSATRLAENFTLGFTDPAVNSPCLDADARPIGDPSLRTVSQCQGGLTPNPDFSPNLLAFDLSRNGGLFAFNGEATVKEQAAYVQDDIKAGNATFKLAE